MPKLSLDGLKSVFRTLKSFSLVSLSFLSRFEGNNLLLPKMALFQKEAESVKTHKAELFQELFRLPVKHLSANCGGLLKVAYLPRLKPLTPPVRPSAPPLPPPPLLPSFSSSKDI